LPPASCAAERQTCLDGAFAKIARAAMGRRQKGPTWRDTIASVQTGEGKRRTPGSGEGQLD